MKKYFYCYKNDKIGVFNDPFEAPYEPERMIEAVGNMAKANDDPKKHLEELSLYRIFEFDDKSATIKYELEFLVSLSEFMKNGD